MEKYFLNTLIFFLKTQQELGFRGIEQVLSIVEHKRYKDEKKRKLIIEVFRFYGLNETSFRSGEFVFGDSMPVQETPSKNAEDTIPIVAQTFNLRLLNGTLELPVPLN